MTSTWTLDRSREAIARLSRAGLDWQTFSADALPHLRRAIGFDCWCLSLNDPDTDLPAGAVSANPLLAARQSRFWQLEFQVPDVNKHTMLIRAPGKVGLLSTATGGDMLRSARWAELLGPGGLGDELRAPLVTGGLAWGALAIYRERSSPFFTTDQARWVSGLIGELGSAARAAWAAAHPAAGPPDTGPGTIVVTPDGTPVSTTAAARHWLDRLGLPAHGTICALTAKAAAGADHPNPARVRVRTSGGQWLTMHAAVLAGMAGNVAISVQPAHPAELVPLLMRATALSARERDIVPLILAGLSVGDIARQLHISPHTVQDHLKAIYVKTGVRSRRRLAVRMCALV
jgi:DNA-binding CsgD family transcriptional regulator